MTHNVQKTVLLLLSFIIGLTTAQAQDISVSNSLSWRLSGRIQLQHLYNNQIPSDAAKTRTGFRVRRGRFQVEATVTDRVRAKFQIEVRDNSPRLKDAEGKWSLFDQAYLRFGQFKVPVWREELRSSGKLLLIERSEAAGFLADAFLSARHIGIELGTKLGKKATIALNYSNGAGEGGREDAGRTKTNNINNGKMFSGRLNFSLGNVAELGVSGVMNQRGVKLDTLNSRGIAMAIAPDFGFHFAEGLDAEGGIAVGKISKKVIRENEDQDFWVGDVTVRWKKKLAQTVKQFSGMDALEVAAGLSYIEPNTDVSDDEILYIRFGPGVYFGKQTRLQINGEIEQPTLSGSVTTLKIRTQFTINF